jgi:predicted enzyme related to lactoylglutathione lyase
MSRPANVGHFAIACDDVERAKRFYEQVFGWRIDPWGPPDYHQVFTGTPERPGILGDLRPRHEPPPPSKATPAGTGGFECTIIVQALDEVLAAIGAHGGRVIPGSRYRIEGVGDLAYFEDTEGNRAGVMQYAPGMRYPEGVAQA